MGVVRIALAGALAAVLVVLGLGVAEARDDQRPRIAVTPRVLTYGETATVDAKLVGSSADEGVAVALLERRLPGDGRYREVDRLRADAQGAVRFEIQPSANAYYAVRTRSEPVQTSLGLLVRVRPVIAVVPPVADAVRGQPFTLSGTVAPAMPGGEVVLQRRGEERWRTVATTAARPVTPLPPVEPGPQEEPRQEPEPEPEPQDVERSAFDLVVTARRSARYRVVVPAGDAFSRAVGEPLRVRVVAAATG